MNLLLIDSNIIDKEIVIDSITDDTKYIIFDNMHDTIEDIKNKISSLNLSFTRLGLFQENNNIPFYQLTFKSTRSI